MALFPGKEPRVLLVRRFDVYSVGRAIHSSVSFLGLWHHVVLQVASRALEVGIMRRRKNQRMTQVKMFIHFRLTQHVSDIIMLIVRRGRLNRTASGVSLDVLASVVWSQDTS